MILVREVHRAHPEPPAYLLLDYVGIAVAQRRQLLLKAASASGATMKTAGDKPL
jgi:hypothetical protein